MFIAKKRWLKEVNSLENFQRCYIKSSRSQVVRTELHIFNDASMQAYSSVAYLRSIYKESIETSLVFAKSRFSPKSMKVDKELSVQSKNSHQKFHMKENFLRKLVLRVH
ncbi:hypothetical protein ACFFRR_001947 [Megaselia abdita]